MHVAVPALQLSTVGEASEATQQNSVTMTTTMPMIYCDASGRLRSLPPDALLSPLTHISIIISQGQANETELYLATPVPVVSIALIHCTSAQFKELLRLEPVSLVIR